MRQLHFNVRQYQEPLQLLIFKYEKSQGVSSYELEKKIKIYGSMMHQNSIDNNNNQRATNYQISLIIQKPRFQIKPELAKVISNGIIYKVVKVDFNRLNAGDIQLLLEYEFDDDGRYNG